MKSPDSFFSSISKFKEKADKGIQRNYEISVLRTISPLFEYSMSDIYDLYQEENKDPLDDLRYQVNDPMLDTLFILRMTNKPSIEQLVLRLFKLPLWTYYTEKARNLDNCSVIFPVIKHSNWIMHNYGSVVKDSVRNSVCLTLYPKSSELQPIIIQSLKNFVKERTDE